MNIYEYSIDTCMGKINDRFRSDLSFLSDQEFQDLNEIGYTSKLNNIKTNYSDYLNSLNKGEFKVILTKGDNGDFCESFNIIRVTTNIK